MGAHVTTITVDSKHVEVTYDDVEGDHMGNQNGHKIYFKVELSKDFGKFKDVLDQILHGNNGKSSPIGGSDPAHKPSTNNGDSNNDEDYNDDYGDADNNYSTQPQNTQSQNGQSTNLQQPDHEQQNDE